MLELDPGNKREMEGKNGDVLKANKIAKVNMSGGECGKSERENQTKWLRSHA